MSNEIWKTIKGFEDYEISNNGKIRNIKTKKIRKLWISNGYYQVRLAGNKTNQLVHRLLALTFIQNPNNYPYINHINGIKTDNRIENLEWCTASYNTIHSFNNGLQKTKQIKIDNIIFSSYVNASKYLKTTPSTITTYLCNNRYKYKRHTIEII